MNNNLLYSNAAARLDTVVGAGSPLWANIKLIQKDYQNSGYATIDEYLLDKFGIIIDRVDDGLAHGYSWNYRIQDPQKYTFFLLKYAK